MKAFYKGIISGFSGEFLSLFYGTGLTLRVGRCRMTYMLNTLFNCIYSLIPGLLRLFGVVLRYLLDLSFGLRCRLDGSAFRQFLGGRSGLLLYCSLDGLFFLDFSGDRITSLAAHHYDGRCCTYERFSLGRVDINRYSCVSFGN